MYEKKADSRRTRFHTRITTERQILGMVNSSDLCADFPLAGMTSDAISAWERTARKHLQRGLAARIANQLREIGRRTELLADDSRDVFRPNELVQCDEIEQAKASLRKIVTTH